MSRKKEYIPKTFESDKTFLPKKSNGNNATDVSANIYISMLLSNAWKELTGKQKELYLYCKAQYYGEKKELKKHKSFYEQENNINVDISKRFTMNQSKWQKFYGIYTDSTKRHFYTDMKALVDLGFIIVIENGKISRTKNIYEFSDKWREQGVWQIKKE